MQRWILELATSSPRSDAINIRARRSGQCLHGDFLVREENMRRGADLFQDARENGATNRCRFAVAFAVSVFVLGWLVFGVSCTTADDEPGDALT